MRYVYIDYAFIDENRNRKFRTIGIDTERNDWCSWDEGGVIWENPRKFEEKIDPVGLLEDMRKKDSDPKKTGFYVGIVMGDEDRFGRPFDRDEHQKLLDKKTELKQRLSDLLQHGTATKILVSMNTYNMIDMSVYEGVPVRMSTDVPDDEFVLR